MTCFNNCLSTYFQAKLGFTGVIIIKDAIEMIQRDTTQRNSKVVAIFIFRMKPRKSPEHCIAGCESVNAQRMELADYGIFVPKIEASIFNTHLCE